MTVELLKLFFPTEIAYIQEKADEEKLYRIISGANVRSDVEAGIALEEKIAAKFNKSRKRWSRSRNRNTSNMGTIRIQRYRKRRNTLISLDAPKRPPMLPLFGNVKSFLMTLQLM